MRNETDRETVDNVTVSTHRWWPFTVVACLKLGDLFNEYWLAMFKNRTFIENNQRAKRKDHYKKSCECNTGWKCETVLDGLFSFKIVREM